ncbi:variant surface glycoprotein, (VSG), putative [Trypanosoma vivax Y486]|uniref:Variant surface glycoprotein, (VSG), putative n=1 Tax=Trypanosoma vivax (strain Y486) TaxID=1055687 RepID=F9WU27_TRYVY|nr:variant surface glycoprotein, (VSG), putative [Trypanosoma vivax Y486]|eukprot:CCD21073.1 variant surface glycoprotein, (VSG), putative [Trypanosoma vivax Y486]
MHKLALAVFCVSAARTSQRALAGEPNAGDTVEDFRKVCAATHALGAVKSLSEAIAGRVKEVTEGARRVGEELECQLRIKRSARQLVAKLAPSCIDSSEAETAQKNASALVVCAADAINGEAVKLKNTAGTAAAEVIDGNKDGKVEGGAALARLWSAISRGTNNAWDGQAHKMRGSGLAIAMIYLCNNANPDPNGCGTSGGRNCPCVPQGFTAKTSDEERSTVETTPRIIHTGRQNKDGKKDSGEWTKLTHNTRMTAEELRTNLGAAKRICDALEDTTKQNLNTADTIEQTVTALVRAMKRTDEEGEARCLGRMDEANGWDGSSGEKGACICYKTPGKNTTAISWASKALTAVRALRSLLRTEQQAAQLNTLAAAWAGTQEHTQQQHEAGHTRTRRTAATAREHTSTPTASPRDNSHKHQQNDSTDQQTEDGARAQCEKDGGTWDPKEHACNNTAKKDTTHTRRTLDAALTMATLALTASAWR